MGTLTTSNSNDIPPLIPSDPATGVDDQKDYNDALQKMEADFKTEIEKIEEEKGGSLKTVDILTFLADEREKVNEFSDDLPQNMIDALATKLEQATESFAKLFTITLGERTEYGGKKIYYDVSSLYDFVTKYSKDGKFNIDNLNSLVSQVKSGKYTDDALKKTMEDLKDRMLKVTATIGTLPSPKQGDLNNFITDTFGDL